MAPQSRPFRRKGKDQPSTDTSETIATSETDQRNWNGRPYDEYPWYMQNKKLVYDEVRGAREFFIVYRRTSRRCLEARLCKH